MRPIPVTFLAISLTSAAAAPGCSAPGDRVTADRPGRAGAPPLLGPHPVRRAGRRVCDLPPSAPGVRRWSRPVAGSAGAARLHAEGVMEHPLLAEPDTGQGRFRFRTPTLRNVALTAPYVHNGMLASLEDLLEFYDNGRSENPNVASGGRAHTVRRPGLSASGGHDPAADGRHRGVPPFSHGRAVRPHRAEQRPERSSSRRPHLPRLVLKDAGSQPGPWSPGRRGDPVVLGAPWSRITVGPGGRHALRYRRLPLGWTHLLERGHGEFLFEAVRHGQR